MRLPSTEDIRESKEILLQDIEKKLRFKDDTPHFAHQQVLGSVRLCSSALIEWLMNIIMQTKIKKGSSAIC